MDARRNRSYISLGMSRDTEDQSPRTLRTRPWAAVISFLILVLLLFLLGVQRRSPSSLIQAPSATATRAQNNNSTSTTPADKLLGGLLSPNFDESSCLSRYQAVLFRKVSPHTPSPYLIQRLREYEALHKKCGPNTALYNRSIARLKSGNGNNDPLDCNYVVWIPHNGLGNRIITIVSAFLYALLNNRVLLVHIPADIAGLLCEPFLDSSWALPPEFPNENFLNFDSDTPQSYGNMLRNNNFTSSNAKLPPYVYLHLPWYYNEYDKRFFCEDAQRTLREIPWLGLKSDHYFVPSLFLLEEYDEELRRLFPKRSTVFHHLVRYLIHPSNEVWGHITRYYEAYLARADQRVGIQIRVFKNFPVPFEEMLDQIINCSLRENILPAVTEPASPTAIDAKVKAVFVTNLQSGFYERIKDMYYERATATGKVVGVYQSSHAEEQKSELRSHNVKALTEIELLSFSDVLITSAWSTFGYVAQGLGGLEPWILLRQTQSNLPCRRAASSEPCFLMPPPARCSKDDGSSAGEGAGVRYVRQCEDEINGFKLFDD